MIRFGLIAAALACLVAPWAHADVRPHGLFGDHMVLQAGERVPVWGWAEPGERVLVSLGEIQADTVTDADGKWRVDLLDVPANSEPQTLTIAGTNTVTISDVLVGDVWLCSGQSNMEFGIWNLVKDQDVRAAIVDPMIRTFFVTKHADLSPVANIQTIPKELVWDSLSGHWQVDKVAGSWNGFSAVGYYFGKEIRAVTGQPVGLIGAYWGGTPVQAWTSREALEAEPSLARYVRAVDNLPPERRAKFPVVWADYVAAMRKWTDESYRPHAIAMKQWETDAAKAKESGNAPPPKPEMPFPRPRNPGNVGTTTSLYNGMIAPLIPYAIKGVIWYQGEANVGSREYDRLFTTMIQDWRRRWGQGDFPFLFVQLASYSKNTRGDWPDLRRQQQAALALPNTGMAVAIDVGDPRDIHPRRKEVVGQRLARIAAAQVYGQDVVYSGPVFAGATVDGDQVTVRFDHIGAGLAILPAPPMPGQAPGPTPDTLLGFELADADGRWHPAAASISGDTVVLQSSDAPTPTAIRYAWADHPHCSLYNQDGLPAVPFQHQLAD